MKARLLSTVAASLLIGIGAASAQSMNQQQHAPARAPAAQQSAPAEKVAPPMKAGERKAPETTGQASPDSKMDKGATGSMNKSSTTSGQAPKAADQDKPGMKGAADTKSSSDTMKKSSSDTGKDGSGSSATMKSDTNKSASDNAQGTSSTSSTTGQGAAAGQVKLSTEQRTKITSVIKSQKVERIEPSKLNVSISVGTKIPSSVRVHRLPAEVVTIYPEWRGYDYILVADQIIIIEPRTHEIVFILEA